MSYGSKSIIKDVNNKPVPQYWNPTTQQFEVIKSETGKLKVSLINSEGNYILTQDLVDQISLKIDELVGVVNSIGL